MFCTVRLVGYFHAVIVFIISVLVFISSAVTSLTPALWVKAYPKKGYQCGESDRGKHNDMARLAMENMSFISFHGNNNIALRRV